MPRCQDWPMKCVATPSRIRASHPCQIVVLSICWLDRDHPDRHGEQLARLACFFRAKMRSEDPDQGGEFFVLWDYCSLPQRHISGRDDRSLAERETFKAVLGSINIFYAHPCTTVFLCSRLPADLSRYANTTPYSARGWTLTEKTLASIATDSWLLLDTGALFDGAWLPALEHLTWYTIFTVCRGSRAPPVPPDAFGRLLADGVAASRIKFTNATDLQLVSRQYALGFHQQLREATMLAYGGAGWGDAEVGTLCDALLSAHRAHGGGLAQLGELLLWGNRLGDSAATRLASLLEQGTLPGLQTLELEDNPEMSAAGRQLLSRACEAAGVRKLLFRAEAGREKPRHLVQANELLALGQGATPP